MEQELEELSFDVGNEVNIQWLVVSEENIEEHTYNTCIFKANKKLPKTFYIGCTYRKFKNPDIRIPIYFHSSDTPFTDKNFKLIGMPLVREIIIDKLKEYTEDPYVMMFDTTSIELNNKIDQVVLKDQKKHELGSIFDMYPNIVLEEGHSTTTHSQTSGLVLFLIFSMIGLFLFFFQKFIMQL